MITIPEPSQALQVISKCSLTPASCQYLLSPPHLQNIQRNTANIFPWYPSPLCFKVRWCKPYLRSNSLFYNEDIQDAYFLKLTFLIIVITDKSWQKSLLDNRNLVIDMQAKTVMSFPQVKLWGKFPWSCIYFHSVVSPF